MEGLVKTKSYLLSIALAVAICASVSPLNAQSYPSDSSSHERRYGSRLEVPAGTAISVRTGETIDSTTASPNQRFSANVDDDVKGSAGEVLIPRGSRANLIIRDARNGGTTGSSSLVLDLDSVELEGHTYTVSTEDLSQSGNSGIGKNRRTAEMVGGGAVLGTLIGAIAGGGKGAAIGAAVGAAAGGTTQVLTRGKQVKVPAETVLNFQLDQSLLLRSQSY
jgi:hypothetical protein